MWFLGGSTLQRTFLGAKQSPGELDLTQSYPAEKSTLHLGPATPFFSDDICS